MRLSPKSIFLGIVAFGLPIAVTTGWTLGAPPPARSVPAPGSAGGIGTAPSAPAPVAVASVAPAAQTWISVPPRSVPAATARTNQASRGPAVRPSRSSPHPSPRLTLPPVSAPTDTTPEPTEEPPHTPPSGEPSATP